MNAKSNFKPRIIIHGCGNVGQRVVRFCDKKGWQVVAAFNRAGPKVGQDIGQLAGLAKDMNVRIQDAEPLEIPRGMADIAVVATTNSDFMEAAYPIYEKYLSAGINVIAHGSQPHNPFFDDPEVAKNIEALARANQVTFSGSTIWDTTRVWSGILAASNCVEIECVEHLSTGDPGLQNPIYEGRVGIGMAVDAFAAMYLKQPHPLEKLLHGPPVMVLQNLGCTITKIEKRTEPIVLQAPKYSRHSKIEYPAGVVGGLRIIAEIETAEGIKGRAQVEYRLHDEGEAELTSWKIHGTPDMEINIARGDAGAISAASIFNRIPDVIAARPGIVEIFSKEMGPMSSSALL